MKNTANKKYIVTSRKKVSEKKSQKINLSALVYHVMRSKPKKSWTSQEVYNEILKDNVDTKLKKVSHALTILSGAGNRRIQPEYRRDEIMVTGSKGKYNTYKINPEGTVRVMSTKALRVVTYNNTKKAEFVSIR